MTVSLSTLEVIIREAGDIALSYFNDLQNLEISQKSPRDFVTAADVSVEKFLQAELGKHYPEYGFWGEESGQSNNQTKRWIVDPIDGTHSFAKGQYYWSISVALELDQELIVGAVFEAIV
jgi:myo-inositol-1(or 4)-monophosphatase